MRSGLAAILVALWSTSASAATLHVDARNASPATGSASAPFAAVQTAIDAATTGDIIKVASGTYAPIVVSNKVLTLEGGYAGASAADYAAMLAGDFAVQDRDAHVTRIAGGGAGRGDVVLLDAAGTTVVDGFYISGGGRGVRSDGTPYAAHNPILRNNVIEDNVSGVLDDGGGIWCKTSLTIQNNLIRDNQSGRGAGIFCTAPVVHIHGNVVEDNIGVGDHGGGLFVGADDTVIADNLVRNNVTGYGGTYGVGGGILVLGLGTVAVLSGNVVTGNQAPKRGAGIFIDDEATATLRNELVYANGCGWGGGAGIAVDGYDTTRPSHATLVNVTVANHVCPGDGNGLQVENSTAEVMSSIFWSNGDDFVTLGPATLTVSYTLSAEAMAGPGNFGADPLFANPALGDFHVLSQGGRFQPDGGAGTWILDALHSPAIDAGDPLAASSAEPAPNGARINLGADGNTAFASKSALGGAGGAGGSGGAGGIAGEGGAGGAGGAGAAGGFGGAGGEATAGAGGESTAGAGGGGMAGHGMGGEGTAGHGQGGDGMGGEGSAVTPPANVSTDPGCAFSPGGRWNGLALLALALAALAARTYRRR
jgi:hypothetical protein